MSTLIELMPRIASEADPRAASVELPSETQLDVSVSDRSSIAEDQIRRLVRQVFVHGGQRRARQVVFSPADEETEVADLCMMVGEALTMQDSGTICVVETLPRGCTAGIRPIDRPPSRLQGSFGILRDASQQLSSRLWFMPGEVLLDGCGPHWSGSWIRGRLAELRLDFDYSVVQGPAIGVHDEAGFLGSLCDGVVLVLRANRTRRLVAQSVIEKLRVAKIRLLGVVLTERTFPVPGAVYCRL
ncbi:MAG TPA: hypothetical protein VEI26_05815 [Terriglobales bacterium]|nr:hypothetical protein [Terriglobales bacterium]